MTMLPDPVWPVLVLAVICLVDAVICVRPMPFIARCLTDVDLPRRYWPVLPVVKGAAAVGLVAGLWIPGLGLVTTVCLVLYFVVAISAHLRARDIGRNLLNATGMLLICLATLVFCFLR